jgi:hypothetical protein
MEKRMDESNSTAERHAREPEFNVRPWVETVMRAVEIQKKRQAINRWARLLGWSGTEWFRGTFSKK